MFSLNLLGGASLTSPQGPVVGPAAQRHRLALLALLAMARSGTISRERLLGYLWPEHDTGSGRRLLRVALHALRKTLGEDVLPSEGEDLRLVCGLVVCDVRAFESALADGDPARAVALYTGPFLDGFFLDNAPEFERWVQGERDRLERIYADALERLAEQATAEEDLRSAVGWWKRLAAHDPFCGRIALQTMRALDASGDRAGALQHARVHAALLREEFGTEPNGAIEALTEHLRSEPSAADRLPLTPMGRKGSADDTAPVVSRCDGEFTQLQATMEGLAPGRNTGRPSRDRHRVGARRRKQLVRAARVPAAVVGGVALFGVVFVAAIGSPAPTTLPPERVLVATFDNRTGDESLEPLGRVAGDWIAQGLGELESVVVDSRSDTLLASGLGSGTLVSGSYHRQRDSIWFRAQVTDIGAQRVLHSLAPVAAPVSAPQHAIEVVRQRVMTALAARSDPHLAGWEVAAAQPPMYAAYQQYVQGLDAYMRSDLLGAADHFERAAEMDSTFLRALVRAAQSHRYSAWQTGQNWRRARADSISSFLDRRRERLSSYDRHHLDFQRAMGQTADRDLLAAYQAGQGMLEAAPGSADALKEAALSAVRVNRPGEAVNLLRRLDPESGLMAEWDEYWWQLTSAQHMLGDHHQELRTARRGQRQHPDHLGILTGEARALAALGRTAEVKRLMDRVLSLPDHKSWFVGRWVLITAAELRAHGHRDASVALLNRAIAWADDLPREEAMRPLWRYTRAQMLYAAGRWDEAQVRFEALAREEPAFTNHRGYLGVIAARTGDRARALEISATLAEEGAKPWSGEGLRPFWYVYWRGAIAAALGEKEQATLLLHKALVRGLGHEGAPVHSNLLFAPLHGYPPFQELIRPKG